MWVPTESLEANPAGPHVGTPQLSPYMGPCMLLTPQAGIPDGANPLKSPYMDLNWGVGRNLTTGKLVPEFACSIFTV